MCYIYTVWPDQTALRGSEGSIKSAAALVTCVLENAGSLKKRMSRDEIYWLISKNHTLCIQRWF